MIITPVWYSVRTFGFKGKPYRIKIFDVVIRKEVFCIRGKYISCFKIGSITVWFLIVPWENWLTLLLQLINPAKFPTSFGKVKRQFKQFLISKFFHKCSWAILPLDLDIINLAWAQVTFWTNPVASIIRAWAFGSSSIVIIIKGSLLQSGDFFNKIVSRLIRDVGIFFQENGILADLFSNFVGRIIRIFQTKWDISMEGTGWWGLGVTISTMRGMGRAMMGYRMMRGMNTHNQGQKYGRNL